MVPMAHDLPHQGRASSRSPSPDVLDIEFPDDRQSHLAYRSKRHKVILMGLPCIIKSQKSMHAREDHKIADI